MCAPRPPPPALALATLAPAFVATAPTTALATSVTPAPRRASAFIAGHTLPNRALPRQALLVVG